MNLCFGLLDVDGGEENYSINYGRGNGNSRETSFIIRSKGAQLREGIYERFREQCVAQIKEGFFIYSNHDSDVIWYVVGAHFNIKDERTFEMILQFSKDPSTGDPAVDFVAVEEAAFANVGGGGGGVRGGGGGLLGLSIKAPVNIDEDVASLYDGSPAAREVSPEDFPCRFCNRQGDCMWGIYCDAIQAAAAASITSPVTSPGGPGGAAANTISSLNYKKQKQYIRERLIKKHLEADGNCPVCLNAACDGLDWRNMLLCCENGCPICRTCAVGLKKCPVCRTEGGRFE